MTYLPEKGRLSLAAPFAEKAELGKATMRQLEKDFHLQGLTLQLPEEVPVYPALLEMVAESLREQDVLHKSLPRLLYQLDIDEGHIRAVIANAKPDDIHHLLAHEMLVRCFTKVLFREKHK